MGSNIVTAYVGMAYMPLHQELCTTISLSRRIFRFAVSFP